MAKGKFATSVSCMDGRIQIPLINWIKENFSVDYVDTITEPGIDKLVADNTDLESIKIKVGIVSGHYDCAGNPVSNEEHITQIKKGIEVISSWNLGVKVVGVWVDDTWKINTV